VLLTSLTPVAAGVFAYLVAVALNQSQAFAVLYAVLAAGFTLMGRLVFIYGRRLTDIEVLQRESRIEVRELVGHAVTEISHAAELFGEIENSALPTDLVTRLIRHSTRISAESPPIIARLAGQKVAETSELLRQLGEGGTVTYYGEDRDWLLGLTRSASVSIDAISFPRVDEGLGQPFLDAQRRAVRNGVRVRRIVVLDRLTIEREPVLRAAIEQQRRWGVEIRLLDRADVPSPLLVQLRDLILFDEAVVYETIFTSPDPALAQVAESRLNLAERRVRETTQLFGEYWDVARGPDYLDLDVYLDTDDEDTATRVLKAVDDVAVWLGHQRPDEIERHRGSLFWRGRTRPGNQLTQHEMAERLARLEQALRDATSNGSPRAHESSGSEIQMAAGLIASLVEVQHACIRVDRMLLVKYSGAAGAVLVVRSLSDRELHILEERPNLQTDPRTILSELDREVRRLNPAR
jgi:hypothetical protein